MTAAAVSLHDPLVPGSWRVAAADGFRVVPGLWRRTLSVAGDLGAAVALSLCLPYVLLAIGAPIVFGFRLLIWLGGRF